MGILKFSADLGSKRKVCILVLSKNILKYLLPMSLLINIYLHLSQLWKVPDKRCSCFWILFGTCCKVTQTLKCTYFYYKWHKMDHTATTHGLSAKCAVWHERWWWPTGSSSYKCGSGHLFLFLLLNLLILWHNCLVKRLFFKKEIQMNAIRWY